MKKIASALLFVSLVVSSNAGATVTRHFGNNWGKYTAGTVTLAAVGSAIYYDYKYNDSEYLNKASNYLNEAKELIDHNRKAAAGILAAVIATSGIAVDLSRGSEKSAIRKSGRWTVEQTVNAKNGIVKGAANTKNRVKGWFKRGTSVNTLTLNSKTIALLKKAGLNTVEKIINASDDVITAINGIGKATLNKIRESLPKVEEKIVVDISVDKTPEYSDSDSDSAE